MYQKRYSNLSMSLTLCSDCSLNESKFCITVKEKVLGFSKVTFLCHFESVEIARIEKLTESNSL